MEYIQFGQIVSTHALKGNVRINVFSDDVENIKKYENIYLEENGKYIRYEVLNITFSRNQAIVSFKDIDNKEKADEYRNRYIYINKKDLDTLDEDTYYLVDILESEVYELKDNKEEYFGKLIEVNQNAPTDIYVIQTDKNHSIMIPAIREYIKEVDVEKRKIVVDLSNYEI